MSLITMLVQLVRACARTLTILVCVDGLASYMMAFRRVFRHPVRTGRREQPRLVPKEELLMGLVVKRYVQRRVASVDRRVVRGPEAVIAAVLATTGGGRGINTADIERLNATFRAFLAPLVCRGRAIAHTEPLVTAGTKLVGGAYNCCWLHESLRLRAPAGACWKWQERTPAMAMGLTNHRWTTQELLGYQVPWPAWVAPKRRGRRPKGVQQPAMALAT